MTKEYEDFVKTTDLTLKKEDLQFYLDGMNEENGEVSGIFKRVRRGDYNFLKEGSQLFPSELISKHGIKIVLEVFPEIKEDVLKEIGDRHWYTTRFLQRIGSSMSEVELINMKKLSERVAQKKIMGKGDAREKEN